MTGGGTADLAFGFEGSFLGSVTDTGTDGNPDYYGFGRDPTLTEASLDNVLQRLNQGNATFSVESVNDNFEGAVTIEAVVSDAVFGEVEDLVFNGTDGSGDKTIVGGRPQSFKIYAGIDYLDGTTERVLEGAIVTDFEIRYQQDGKNRFTLTCLYADESSNTTITPSSVTTAADGDYSTAHDFDLSIDTVTVPKLQSATLSISNIARFQRDGNPTPADIVVAQPTASLETTGIYDGPTRLELALGASGATSTEDRVNSVGATLTLSSAATTISTYNLAKCTPGTYGWSDLISGDADLVENVSWNVDGEPAVSVA